MDFFDWISVVSFIVGILNLNLNEQQSNALDTHLSIQDEELLKKIIEQNETIIAILKEKQND